MVDLELPVSDAGTSMRNGADFVMEVGGLRVWAAVLLLMPSVALAETLEQRLLSDGSHVVLSLALPIDVLQEGVRADVVRPYAGEQRDTIDQLSDSVVTWSAQVTGFQLSDADGRLQADVIARGAATVEGKLGFMGAEETVELAVDSVITAGVSVRSDWSMVLDLDGQARLIEADVRILGINLSLRSELQPELDRAFRRGLRDIEDDFAEDVDLREALRRNWFAICEGPGFDGLNIRPVPRDIAVMQPQFGGGVLRLTVVMTADLMADDGTRCPGLPEMLTLLE